ncbi:MAG TPA: DUF6035 family protein [Ignavibacteriaceae bacterium]|nr:DUF6035 family protein [Ignavibacteriaceae bacterium]
MSPNNNYTIDEVLDLENGEIIYSNDFFEKSLEEIHQIRSKLQEAIQGIRKSFYVCLYCKQMVGIRGSGISKIKSRKVKYHFAHLRDSKECPIKTASGLTKEEINRLKYNGTKEGKQHFDLKNKIADFLRLNEKMIGNVSNVQVEKTIRDVVSKEWKKPDIQFMYGNDKVALELQLSTTWLDVITKRQNFYKQNGVFILWVFYRFNIDDEQRRFTDNDVIYTNNQNAFIFDEEAILESKRVKDLVLKCYFKNYKVTFNEIDGIWEQRFVKLSELTFLKDQRKVFFFDSESERQKALLEAKEFSTDIINETTKSITEKVTYQQSLNSREKLDDSKTSELYAYLSKIKRQISDIEEKLKNNKFIIDNIVKSTNNIYMWLLDEERLNVMCSYKFCLDIRKHYGPIVKNIHIKKQISEKEMNELQRKIKNINSLQILNENFPYLKVVNPNNHKALFEQQLTSIGYIYIKDNTPLFFETHKLMDYREFNRIRYKDGITFVFDFSLRLKELENHIQNLNKDLFNFEQTSNEIKRKAQDYIEGLIKKESKELISELAALKQKRKKVEVDLEIEDNKKIF